MNYDSEYRGQDTGFGTQFFFFHRSKPLKFREDELWLPTPFYFDARLVDRTTSVTGSYTVGLFTFRQRATHSFYGPLRVRRQACLDSLS